MGIILDSSVLIAYERRRFDLEQLLTDHADPAIAAITAGELLIGVERADTPERRARRQTFVDNLFAQLPIVPFELPQAQLYALHFAKLAGAGFKIGDRDLQIAVTALSLGFDLATLNVGEFKRIDGLNLVDVSKYQAAKP
jgi:tRNA(fMet)-specific endonuclease VapC